MFTIDAFTAWLLGQEDRLDAVGELAATVARDLSRGVPVPIHPWPTTVACATAWRNYLTARHAEPSALAALEQALIEYDAEFDALSRPVAFSCTPGPPPLYRMRQFHPFLFRVFPYVSTQGGPMRTARLRRVFVAISLVVGLCAVVWLVANSTQPAKANHAIELKAPALPYAASPESAAALSAIADEAGIAAYFTAGKTLNLDTVADKFRTVEARTADYILGSVAVEGYLELYDVHVYVHKSGWFMAYYLASDPASKMLDMKAYTGGPLGTKLEKVLTILASEAGVTYPGVTFWHFQYPNANRMMAIGETYEDSNTFTVKLPSSFVFAERSWALNTGSYIVLKLDDQELYAGSPQGGSTEAGIRADQMPLDTTLTFTVADRGGNTGAIVLIYSVP